MSATPSKIHRMIQRLTEKTYRGEIRWQTADLNNERFQVTFPSYSVHTSRSAGEGALVEIYNEEGTLIEGIHAPKLAESAGISPDSALRLMNELYESARRNALGVENALDDILSSLDGL